MKKYLFLMSLTLLFACCKDKPVIEIPEPNRTTIDLTFTDNFSHEPVKDLTLNLYECDVDALSNIINKVYLGSYKTDANGKFYIVVKDLNKNKSHGIEWKKPSECYEEYNYGIRVGEKNVYARTLLCNANLAFHFKNITPFDENDKLFFCRSLTREPSEYCFTNAPVGSGMSVDYTQTLPLSGNTKYYVHWKSIKNSVETIYHDSITTIPCITNTVDIFY
jgi:hypothetical protein